MLIPAGAGLALGDLDMNLKITELAALRYALTETYDESSENDDAAMGQAEFDLYSDKNTEIERLIGLSEMNNDDVSAVFDMLLNKGRVAGMHEGFQDGFRDKLLAKLRDFIVKTLMPQEAQKLAA
jgi:hypothetical protein